MSEHRHFTTRRGFIAAMGFGALGLYGTWAVYGASPFPFASPFTTPPVSPHDAMPAHESHDAARVEVHGHEEASALMPDEFAEKQAAFLARFRRDDGTVHPAGEDPAAAPDDAPMSHMSMAGMPAMPGMDQPVAEAVDVYLSAGRFAFEPDALVLEKGQRYRFLMLATDVTHGAAIALGHASRIVRLRPGIVTNLELTFPEAGEHLLYCTVNCGIGHDVMSAKITVV